MKSAIQWIVMGMMVGWTAPAVFAGETAPRHYERPELNRGQEKQVEKLSERYGVRERIVLRLRDKGLGWGEVRHVLALSRASDKSVWEIYRMRRDGMGWGQIRRDLDLHPGALRPERGREHHREHGGWDRVERVERCDRQGRWERGGRDNRADRGWRGRGHGG